MIPPALGSWTEPSPQPDVVYDKMVTGMRTFLAEAVRVERPYRKVDVWDGAGRQICERSDLRHDRYNNDDVTWFLPH